MNRSSLVDLQQLRRDYIRRGGQNAEFLQNLMSMEEFFTAQKSKQKEMINNPNALSILRGNNNSGLTSYLHPEISQADLLESFAQEMQNHSAVFLRNQLTLPSSNPSYYARDDRGNNMTIAGIQTDPDRKYEYLKIQEADVLMEMSRLHVNSYDYQKKQEELQKIRALMNAIENSVIVQRVVNKSIMMQGNSYNSANQSILSKNFPDLMRPLAAEAKEGFIIRFDYASFLPIVFQDAQINFGIYKRGQKLETFLHTATYKVEQESDNTARCILAEMRSIYQVMPHFDAVMYFELHANERHPSKKKLQLRSWTMHQLFDENLILHCGRFRLPFYHKSLSPATLMQSGLMPIAECHLYIRICYPNDPMLDIDNLVYLENDYKIPPFYIQNKPQTAQASQYNQPMDHDDTQRIILNELESQQQKQYDGETSSSQIYDSDPTTSRKQLTKSMKSVADKTNLSQSQSSFYNQPYIQFSNKNESAIIAHSVTSHISEEPALIDGVIVRILKLERFTGSNKSSKEPVKVNLKIFDGSKILSDSSDKLCEATSGDTLMLAGKDNIIDFEHAFMIRTRQILQSYGPTRLRQVYLLINLMNSANASIGWLVTPLFKVDTRNIGDINNGKFRQHLYQPPLKKAPFSSLQLKTSTPSNLVLDYMIHDPEILEDEVKVYDQTGGSQKIPSSSALIPSAANKPTSLELMTQDGPKNLLVIEVDQMKNYTNKMSLSYDLVVLSEQQVVKDEFGSPSVYQFEELVPAEDSQSTVPLNATVNLPLDLQLAMTEKRPGWQKYYILFKFVEVNLQDEEKVLGWYVHQLYKTNLTINSGKFAVNVYDPPIQVGTSISKTALKKRKEMFSYSVAIKLLPAAEFNKFEQSQLDQSVSIKSKAQIQQSMSQSIPRQQQNKQSIPPQSKSQSIPPKSKSKLIAVINDLRGIEGNTNLQVNVALMVGDDVILAESGAKCQFQGDARTCTNGTITFVQKIAFDVSEIYLSQKYRQKLSSVRLVLYFVTAQKVTKYWYCQSLFDASSMFQLGQFQEKVFKVPMQKLGAFDRAKLKESPALVQFSLFEGYDDGDDSQSYA